ncbi:MAG: VWA domain-containing protein [Terriglobales bacterium]
MRNSGIPDPILGNSGASNAVSRRLAVFWCALLVLLPLGLAAQQVHVRPRVPPPAPAAPANPAKPKWMKPNAPVNLTANVNQVLVPVTVTDPMDRLVTGLSEDQFAVYEDGVKQKLNTFSTDDAPISVGIVFDSSGSMSDKIEKSRQALGAFFRTANPQDEFFIVDFSAEPHLLGGFSDQPSQLLNRVAFIPAHGRTALLDAIYLGLEEMRQADHSRKALLIISDGGDNHSRYTEDEIRNVVRESNVEIYAIGVFSLVGDRFTPEEREGPALLSDICQASGGRMFTVQDVDELPDIAEKIGEELRNQYLLGYIPTDQQRNGKWRKIHVKLHPPPGLPPLTVYARAGYYGPH